MTVSEQQHYVTQRLLNTLGSDWEPTPESDFDRTFRRTSLRHKRFQHLQVMIRAGSSPETRWWEVRARRAYSTSRNDASCNYSGRGWRERLVADAACVAHEWAYRRERTSVPQESVT